MVIITGFINKKRQYKGADPILILSLCIMHILFHQPDIVLNQVNQGF